MKFQDQIGNTLELLKIPQRIISLVPSQTELLVDLGLEKNIVGITKFCVHPVDLKQEKTIVGGTKNIHLQKIKELQPDIILCNKEENTKEIVEFCMQIAPTHVSDIYTIEDVLELTRHYGEILNCSAKSFIIQKKLQKELNNFEQFVKDKKIEKVAYFIWKNPWMVAANNTFINHILGLNKFDNFYKNHSRYPEINLDELLKERDLGTIFLSSEPYPFKEKDIIELQGQFEKAKIILVDGEMFSWYGSRLLKAFNYFKSLHD
ncbi:helical backbone metal receptor [Polaribacter sp. MSW13]|uniref:Helical backbone metal receptor n=1 Tax=Polaribacter marinus TaxID=2916838 RepID=A0A9X1VN33_9FLAO|nr:helical backbone metal receptor [Polaribacter marinus]MCI2229083.1 helical backbone metal receptor [Polaribacter marinus]